MKKILLVLISIFMILLPYNIVKAEGKSYTYAYIDATELGPRQCPSTSCNRVYSDEGNIIWLYRPRVVEVIDYSGSWAKIRFNWYGFTYEGYILQEYLGNKTIVNLDENYANELRSKGFPESYVEKLTKMHMIHPNWNFEVSNTNVSLDDAVNNEYSPVYKNLISTSNKNQLSTDGSAYSNGNYTQFEPGWYAPSRDTLKYYIDPRNFLDDNSIFMFEQLSFKEVSEEDVQKLLNNTFMSGTYEYNGQTYTYASTFVNAGRKYNVNPIHLAARVLQEQGSSGSATSVMSSNGTNYYNYFNFNAWGSSVSEIINNALNYAIRSGWNNPYLAIYGGAEDISDGYINNGQDTLYYQKFNIVGGSRFSHQYMANVQAPYTESYSSYKSYYNASLINTAFTFKIPVYSDMPKATVIATKSNNDNLSSLNIEECSLSPNFDSAITDYTCTVSSTTTSIKVNAQKSDSKAQISGDGNINISQNTTKVTVKVTAEDGSVKNYNVTVNRKEASKETPDDVVKSIGLKNSNNNLSGFTLGSDVSSVISNIKNKYKNADIKVYNSNNKEITKGLISTGQKITIKNNETKSYTIIVKGDTHGDGKISAIDYSKVKSHILNINKLSNSYSYAADTNSDGKISAIDYSKIKSHILNINKLSQ